MAGTLYLIATPIGNAEDITVRAIRVLKDVDLVVCEERREGGRFLRAIGIEKQLETLNEHNEETATETFLRMLEEGKSIGLVSDAGTPVFSDPGLLLVQKAAARQIPIVPIPGASSLLPALTVSGFPIDQFVFRGFLSPKRDQRQIELRSLQRETRTVVLMDTPYRLVQLMSDIVSVLGSDREVCVALDLTMPEERVFRGTAERVFHEVEKVRAKGEFVVVLGPTRQAG